MFPFLIPHQVYDSGTKDSGQEHPKFFINKKINDAWLMIKKNLTLAEIHATTPGISREDVTSTFFM